jgi:hypothetical protein
MDDGGRLSTEDYFMVEMAITSRAYETRWIIQRVIFYILLSERKPVLTWIPQLLRHSQHALQEG